MKFAPAYVTNVLARNFDDARRLFLAPLLAIHRAHLVMLVERGILPAADGRALRAALDRLAVSDLAQARFDGSVEDFFFHVESRLAAMCGEQIAGRLHTARSRNDIDVTMYRMQVREYVLELLDCVLDLRGVLLQRSAEHLATMFPAHTHTQPAQPTTLAHYLVAVVEMLERDAVRLRAAYATANRNPLGACAITGTGFPIDRTRTTEMLGFDAPTRNTYGSIASVDYLLEAIAAVSVAAVGLGRVVQDLLAWCTAEFGYLRLEEGFVQTSSIMPQKRNPVALEHARALASKAVGEAAAVTSVVHNTPFGDIVDTEDDLQPMVFLAFQDAARAFRLVAAALATARFDIERMERKAGENGVTLTELADVLVRDRGLSFREAHRLATGFYEWRAAHPEASAREAFEAASAAAVGRPIELNDARLDEILSARHFVEVRTTPGGPAPAQLVRAIAFSRDSFEADREWLTGARARLDAASRLLDERSRQV